MRTRIQKTLIMIMSAAVTLASGCFSVTAQAPYGPDVKVLSADAPAEVSRTFQKWYILWGIVPLADSDNPKRIIEEEKLVEARVVIADTFKDLLTGGIVAMLTIGMTSPTTVTVEGNRAPRS